jgi:calcium-dependent protein kinase
MGCLNSKNTGDKDAKSKQEQKRPAPKVTQGVRELRKQYDVERSALGSGSYGQVFRAVNKKDKTHVVAIKVIEKKDLTAEEITDIMNEVTILQTLDHPNIVNYYETYDDHKYLYLVMQNCSGGELFDSIERFEKKGKPYSEKMAAETI